MGLPQLGLPASRLCCGIAEQGSERLRGGLYTGPTNYDGTARTWSHETVLYARAHGGVVVDFTFTLGDVTNIAIIIGATVGLALWINSRLNRHQRDHVANTALLSLLVAEASERNPTFRAQIQGFDVVLKAWEGQHVVAGNPITAEEAQQRQQLTQRLRAGQVLSTDELTRLNAILERELADARQTNADLGVVIALLIILGLVIVAMAASGS